MSVLRICGGGGGGDVDGDCEDEVAMVPVPNLQPHKTILYPVDVHGQFASLIARSEDNTTIAVVPFDLQPLPEGADAIPRMIPKGEMCGVCVSTLTRCFRVVACQRLERGGDGERSPL